MRYLGRSVCAAVLLALLITSTAQAQAKTALGQVPGDAWVVLNVNNLQQSSARLAELGKLLAADMFIKEMADPLGGLQKRLNINAGIRKDGDMAVAMFDPAQAGGQPDRSFVIIIPVTNYKEFLTNFKETKHEDNVDVVKINDEEEPGYVADWGTYAALSPSKAMASKQPGGLKVTGATAKILASKDVDVTVYVNLVAISAKYLPELKANRDNMLNELDQSFKQGGGLPQYAPVVRAMVGQLISAAQAGMEDAEAATLSVSFSKDGLGISAIAQFKPESKVGQSIAGMKNTDGPLMAGLPQNDYLFFGGGKMEGQEMDKLLEYLIDPAVQQLKGMDADGKLFAEGISAARTGMRAMKGSAMGFILDPNAQGGMMKSVSVVEANAADVMNSQAKVAEAEQKLFSMMPGPKQTFTYTADAKTVDGVKFARLQQSVAADGKRPEEAAAQQMMQQMFGGNGSTTFVGAVDDKHVISVMADDDKLISAAIAAVKGGADPLSDAANVKITAAKLPQARLGVMYLNVNKAVDAGTAIAAMQIGQRIKLDLPANLPPLGAAVSSEGSALRMDAYIPSQVMTGVVNAVMQMQMRMRGGGAGRPGDL